MAPKSLRYLTILPRYVGNVSNYLPGAGLPYVSDAAIPIFKRLRISRSNVILFTRRDPVRHKSIVFINVAMKTAITIAPVQVTNAGDSPVASSSVSMPPTASAVSEISSIFGILIDSGTAGERFFKYCVSLGHVAAFKMYYNQQLLPVSYFS